MPPSRTACDRPAPRPHEVPGDDRLAVSRGERVRRAPEGSDREREQDRRPARGRRATRGTRSRPSRVPGAVSPRSWRRRAGAVAEREGGGCRDDVERRAQQIVRICAQAVAAALGGHAGGAELGSFFGAHDDLAPADPRGEVPVAEREPGTAAGGGVDGVEAERLQPAGARLARRRAARAGATVRGGRRAGARDRVPPRRRSPRRERASRAGRSGSPPGRARSGRRRDRPRARSPCGG